MTLARAQDDRAQLLGAARALSTIWLATGVSALLGFVASIVLARTLPVDGFGALAASTAAVTLAATIGGYGIGAFWLRIFGLEGSAANRWIAPSMRFASAASMAAACALLLMTPFAFETSINRQLIPILTPLLFMQALLELAQSQAQLEGRHTRVALLQLLPNLGRAVAALAAFNFALGAIETAAALALCAAAATIFALAPLARALKSGFELPADRRLNDAPNVKSPQWRQVRDEAFPFALATVSYPLYFQSSLLALSVLGSNAAAGVFGAAFVVVTALYLLPAVSYQKYLNSKMHWWAEHDRATLGRVHRAGVCILGLSGLVAGTATWALADGIIAVLFGVGFAAAAPVLAVLALGVPFRFLSSAMGGVLLTGHNMRRRAFYEVSAAAVAITAGIALIPAHGALGAAAASVCSEIALCICYTFAARRFWRSAPA